MFKIFRSFLHIDPVAISYLFGCVGYQAAAVVHPLGDIAPYLEGAQRAGLRIRYVFDTHLHADHLSVGRELADAAGADYVFFLGANATPSFRAVHDGDVLELGNVSIEVCTRPDTRQNIWLCS